VDERLEVTDSSPVAALIDSTRHDFGLTGSHHPWEARRDHSRTHRGRDEPAPGIEHGCINGEPPLLGSYEYEQTTKPGDDARDRGGALLAVPPLR
jgi:hypothetical protein